VKAAIVIESGKAPLYGDFKEPVPETGEVQVTVSAAALSNVVKSRASGTHYTDPIRAHRRSKRTEYHPA
jgi:hypothetical protein